jgi:hypothetical protein
MHALDSFFRNLGFRRWLGPRGLRAANSVRVVGGLEIVRVYPDPRRRSETVFADYNIVVNQGKDWISHAMAGAGTAAHAYQNYVVTHIAVGTAGNSSEPPTLTKLVAPSTFPGGAPGKVPNLSFTSIGIAVFDITIQTSDGLDGTAFNEAGLIANGQGANNNLITYKYFTAVTKDPAFDLTVKWTLTFS